MRIDFPTPQFWKGWLLINVTIGTPQLILGRRWYGEKFNWVARQDLVSYRRDKMRDWPAPGSEDTELGVFMEPEVSHGKTKVYTRVQA
jgi:hypothetical protein